ncbi:MAG: Ig-like domain-containing protein [Coprobacter sp.]|nr:Ig-like domain-containing protein [Coprobacter sp.]
MKKIFTLLCVVLLALPIGAQDVSNSLDFTDGDITYTIIDNVNHTCMTKAGDASLIDRKLQITYGNDVSGSVTIPATANNGTDDYDVVAIGSYGFSRASEITVSPGVTTINASAFALNSSLTRVTLPETVTTIEGYAFAGCSALSTVNLPSTLTTIANNTFASSGITAIEIPETVSYIGDNAFSDCTSLASVTIPNSVLQLGKYAFFDCTGLTSVTLSENLTSIGANTFRGCHITSLTIPAGVSSIGEYAFYCSSLTEITSYNKSIPAISYNSFYPSNYSKTVLKVYKSALSSYQKSTLWSNFSNIEVIRIDPTGIAVTPSTLTLNVGTSSQLTAVLSPDEAVGDLTWSIGEMSVSDCATVDQNGKVTSKKIGNATVTVTCGDFTADCNVVIVANPNEMVKIAPLTETLYAGNSTTLTATVYPTTIIPSLEWRSSNTSVATIDASTGVLQAIAPGSAVITATNDNISGQRAITVYEVLPTAVTLDRYSLTMEAGDSETLQATVSPDNVTYPTVTWESSDPNVVIVSDGTVTATGVGSATIRAMCGGVTANCEVTVNPTAATEIVLSQTEATMKATQTLQLSATVNPENTTDKTIEWTSSDNAVATVSTDGVVTALKVGSSTITAKCGSVTADCQITVEVTPADAILLNATAIVLKVNQVQQLAATVLPETTTNPSVTWSSDNGTVASVNEGLVTALSIGTATITASTGNLTATCDVTVEAMPAEQIILDQYVVSVNVGQTVTIAATVLPAETTDPTIVWASNDESVATVTDGVIAGVAPGTTVITATCGPAITSCTVTVLQPATAISLNENSLELEVGDIYDLIETVTPDNTTDVIVWTSSDPDVATVNENGIVTAIKKGETTITATCNENVSASCTVTVSAQPSAIHSIPSDPENGTYNVYNLEGIHLMTTKEKSDLYKLPAGIYIVNGKKAIVK